MKKDCWLLALSIMSAGLLAGCGTVGKIYSVSVHHSPVGAVEKQKTGTVLIRTFVLARKQDPKFGKAIGSIPWAGGPGLNAYFVSSDPLGIGVQTTEFFAEALRAAGYKAVIESNADTSHAAAVLHGEVREFWVYGGMSGADAKIAVALALRSGDGKTVLWQKELSAGQKKDFAFAGYQTWQNESANVIEAALNDILNQAAKEFASDEFYTKIQSP